MLGVMANKRRSVSKGNSNKKQTNPLRRKYGASGVESFIAAHKTINDEQVNNMMMLEPRDWCDYACVGVAEETNGALRCVYDLNLLEHAYALMYAYEEFGYDSIDKVITHATPEQFDMAQEWVSYNTLRAVPHMGPNSPMFIRTHDPRKWQIEAEWTKDW
jgi:hypothetical protein